MKASETLLIILPWCLILISGSRTTGSQHARHDYGSVECVVKALIASPYVRAYYWGSSTAVHPDISSPCDRISERHVIKLREMSPPSSSAISNSRAHVSVYVYPSNLTEHAFGGALTFVLVSEKPVTWHFYSELMGYNVYFQYWISNGSHVSGNGVSKASVHKVPARRMETLTNWIENTLGPISLYTEIIHTNQNISHLVEIDQPRNDDDLCPSMFHPVSGCLAIANRGLQNRDLHIIELLDVGNSRGTVVNLVVKTAVVKRMRRNLMLVLRSHCSAVWVIETRGLRGTLDVVTDNTLNITQIGMQSVRVITERLSGLGGQNLVDWTADKYGQPVSYTYIPLADKIELIVDGHEYYRQSSRDRRPVIPDVFEPDNGTFVEQMTSETPPHMKAPDVQPHQLQQPVDNSLDVLKNQNFAMCDSMVAHKPGVHVLLVIGIAFAAFIIGCLLIGVLWFIHTHTVSRRKPNYRDRIKTIDATIALASKAVSRI